MKPLGLSSKKLLIVLCIFIVGIFGLALFILTLIYPIQGMKVYVEAPTNAPPLVFAAAATNNAMMSAATNNWTTDIPFNDATDKFVSKTDIAQIKQGIPWNKTILHLYFPEYIVVQSPTKAYAKFSRQHIDLRLYLEKSDGAWQLDGTSLSKKEMDRPLNFKERIAESLPR